MRTITGTVITTATLTNSAVNETPLVYAGGVFVSAASGAARSASASIAFSSCWDHGQTGNRGRRTDGRSSTAADG